MHLQTDGTRHADITLQATFYVKLRLDEKRVMAGRDIGTVCSTASYNPATFTINMYFSMTCELKRKRTFPCVCCLFTDRRLSGTFFGIKGLKSETLLNYEHIISVSLKGASVRTLLNSTNLTPI